MPKQTAPKTKMLDKWANALPDRRVIDEFLEWLSKRNDSQALCIADWNIDKFLDDYHGIDRKQLEQERRALLATTRAGA